MNADDEPRLTIDGPGGAATRSTSVAWAAQLGSPLRLIVSADYGDMTFSWWLTRDEAAQLASFIYDQLHTERDRRSDHAGAAMPENRSSGRRENAQNRNPAAPPGRSRRPADSSGS